MFSNYASTPRQAVSAVAALAVIAFGGLVLDQGYVAAAPLGTVEVGALQWAGPQQLAQVTLPEIVVTAERPAERGQRFAAGANTHRSGVRASVSGAGR